MRKLPQPIRSFALAVLSAALAGAVLFGPASPAGAQAQPQTIREIRVQGNKHTSTRVVLSRIKARVGQRYIERVIQNDVAALMATRRFDSVVTTRQQTAEGIVLTFVVNERALVKSVRILGNKQFKTEELLKDIPFAKNDPIDAERIERGRSTLQTRHRNKGYFNVAVTVNDDAVRTGEVTYRIVEGPKASIRKVVFDGNTYFGRFKLWSTIQSKPRLWPFIKGYLDTEQVDRDVDTLRNLYTAEGFLDAEVGREVVFSADQKKITLYFHIKQGPRFRVNEVRFVGNTVYTDRELAARLLLQRGGFFTSAKIQRDLKKLQDTYGEIGFINASVKADRQFLPPDAPPPAWAASLDDGKPALLNVLFTVTEEGQYTVGRVDIRGNSVTQDRVIRRELRFFPQQLFNTVAIEESRRRMEESGYFEPNSVSIKPVGEGANVRDVVVNVQEGRTANFIIGVGVSSNSGLLGNISFVQRNFDINKPGGWDDIKAGRAWKGAGQLFRIQLEPGTELNRASIDWFTPYIGDRPIAYGAKAFVFQRERECYTESRFGVVNSLGKTFPNSWYAEVANRIEGVDISELERRAAREIEDDKGTHLLVGLKGSLTRDRTDSRFLPSTGDKLRFSYEQVVGSYTFGVINAEYAIYRTVWVDALERKHIVSGRMEVGQIVGDAPVFEKFYAGGLGSIRGFDYRGISPRSGPKECPIGGKFLFLAGAEYTFPLVGEQLRGVLFIDTGTATDSGLTPYRVAVGPGIRWILPIFGQVPLNVNLGFPLMKDDQDDTEIFSFSMGLNF